MFTGGSRLGTPSVCTRRSERRPARAMSRWGTAVAFGAPAAMAALLGIEAQRALRGEYLVDVDFTVEDQVTPRGCPAAGDPVRLFILGDSTAAGVGASDMHTSLPMHVARRVAGGTGRAVHVTGHGVSGARTGDVLTEQVPLLPEMGVDALVVVVGANDVTHLTSPWRLTRQTRALALALHDRTRAPIVLGGIPRFAGVDALARPLRGLTDRYAGVLRASQLRGVADLDHVTYVDIASLASPRFIGRPEAMSSDRFHPSGVGYGFWADALAPLVTVLLTSADR